MSGKALLFSACMALVIGVHWTKEVQEARIAFLGRMLIQDDGGP